MKKVFLFCFMTLPMIARADLGCTGDSGTLTVKYKPDATITILFNQQQEFHGSIAHTDASELFPETVYDLVGTQGELAKLTIAQAMETFPCRSRACPNTPIKDKYIAFLKLNNEEHFYDCKEKNLVP